MLLGIVQMPYCGFGNRMLYYYNLRQQAHIKKCDFFTAPWDGYDYFEGNILGKYPVRELYDLADLALGEKFYNYSNLSTREVFKLKNKPVVKDGTCAIHFRGTDFHSWNPDAILDYNYYEQSLDNIKDYAQDYILFSDDKNLEVYKKIKGKLDRESLSYSEGENTNDRTSYIQDFSLMSECDTIISSPSSFCICAGFIGKDKRIIHSNKWVQGRANKNDKFWKDLLNGGNENYSVWRLI
tara:strand:- start:46 stop:762 length:717 start_codon:yes stop_codon:yes gene_type:complete